LLYISDIDKKFGDSSTCKSVTLYVNERPVISFNCLFMFSASKFVNRPTRNGTKIYFNDATWNNVTAEFDCGYAPEVTYTGYTIVIRFPIAPWFAGHFYYVTMDSGMYKFGYVI
jgi:hypothetical protein